MKNQFLNCSGTKMIFSNAPTEAVTGTMTLISRGLGKSVGGLAH
ncbi:MAG: hypothetical protein AAF985_02870 [Bacteroidota bacterium]